MRRRELIGGLGGSAGWLLPSRAAWPQGNPKLGSIGFLRVGSPPPAWIAAFRQGLRDVGLVEGTNVAIIFALTSSEAELPDATAELARMRVGVIIASGTPALMAARDGAAGTPVVFVAAIDPVASGVVASLARPGGNVTGLTNTQADITGKQLQLLRELLPALSRVAMLVPVRGAASARYIEEGASAARALGVQLRVLALSEYGGVEELFAAARGADALLVPDNALFTAERDRIAQAARRSGMPAIFGARELVNAGGLMSYAPDTVDLYRRAAVHVDKILKGAKPADLPVEQPTRFELAINLATAKALGVTVPPLLLARADALVD